MPYMRFNNTNIHYRDEGDGFPLIFLHGLSDSADFWEPLINEFSNKYRIIAPDLRGHGNSNETRKISIDLFTADLHHLLGNLKIKNVNIFGFSLGALVAQNFCLKYPQAVQSMILLSAFSYCTPQLNKTFQKLENCILEGGLSDFFDEMIKLVYTPEFISDHNEIFKYKKTSIEMNFPRVIIESINACNDFNIKKSLSEIKVLTLIFSGCEDILTLPTHSEDLKKDISDSKIIYLDGVGHNLLLPEKIPEIIIEIRKFLKKVD